MVSGSKQVIFGSHNVLRKRQIVSAAISFCSLTYTSRNHYWRLLVITVRLLLLFPKLKEEKDKINVAFSHRDRSFLFFFEQRKLTPSVIGDK